MTTAPTAPTPTPTSGTPTARGWSTGRSSDVTRGKRPRWLMPVVLVGLLLAVSLAASLLGQDAEGIKDDLDPANPGRSGAQGIEHVLRDHGVKVRVARGQSQLLKEDVDGATTFVIVRTDRLSGRTARAALDHVQSAAGVVLLAPDSEVTTGLGLPASTHLTRLADVTAGCPGAEVGADFRLAKADRAYTPTAGGSATTTCFPDKAEGGAAMVTLRAAAGRPAVTILGDDSLISNGAILDADNAAIALRLLGRSDRLLWYVPSLADVTVAESSSRSIAPSWFRPGIALATSAVVFLCLWRGRRLGRLVAEPLPVIVRAVETTESRGRMYRRSRDRSRALVVLQLATRRRLTAYLGLSSSSPVTSVAAAAAAVSGRSYHDVLNQLNSPAAHDDSSLLKLANALSALEKEVRRT